MNNKLVEIQETLFNQLKRVEKEMPLDELNLEIARSNAISGTALTYLKTVNVNIRIKDLADKYSTTNDKIKKELGL